MTDSTETANNDADVGGIVLLNRPPAHCPKRLMLPAHTDTDGRVWPSGGLQHTVTFSLSELLAAGVQVRWKLDDGPEIDEDVGRLLVAARQADWDSGYRPAFPTTLTAPDTAPEAAEPASEKA